MSQTLLSLGSNLGNRKENIIHALEMLEQHDVRIIKQSSFYETEPVGVKDQPWFLNLCIQINTNVSATHLLQICLEIEKKLGRTRRKKWGPRIIDIDILFFDNSIIEQPNLNIPHPHLHKRRFVLVPLAEITPALKHPILGKTVKEMLHECKDENKVRIVINPARL